MRVFELIFFTIIDLSFLLITTTLSYHHFFSTPTLIQFIVLHIKGYSIDKKNLKHITKKNRKKQTRKKKITKHPKNCKKKSKTKK